MPNETYIDYAVRVTPIAHIENNRGTNEQYSNVAFDTIHYDVKRELGGSGRIITNLPINFSGYEAGSPVYFEATAEQTKQLVSANCLVFIKHTGYSYSNGKLGNKNSNLLKIFIGPSIQQLYELCELPPGGAIFIPNSEASRVIALRSKSDSIAVEYLFG